MGFNIAGVLGEGLLDKVSGIIKDFKGDPTVKMQLQAAVDENAAKFRLAELEMEGKIQEQISAQVVAQIEVNKEDAHGNWFQSGWRPACGYVCVLGLLYEFLVQPLLTWFGGIWGWPMAPKLDLGPLIVLLSGMLGLAGLRSVDKHNGVTEQP